MVTVSIGNVYCLDLCLIENEKLKSRKRERGRKRLNDQQLDP